MDGDEESTHCLNRERFGYSNQSEDEDMMAWFVNNYLDIGVALSLMLSLVNVVQLWMRK